MIVTSFAIEELPFCRTMEDIHALFNLLVLTDEDGTETVIKSNGDYEWRTGLTSKPLTHMDMTTCLPPLHAKLRIFSMMLQVAYRYRAGVCKMGKGAGNRLDPAMQAAVGEAKGGLQGDAKKLLASKVDQPDAYGNGGCSDTGGKNN